MANPQTRRWMQRASGQRGWPAYKDLGALGELQLQAEDGDARLISAVAADPTGVDMIAWLPQCGSRKRKRGRLAPATDGAISAISDAPPAPAWLFTSRRRQVPLR